MSFAMKMQNMKTEKLSSGIPNVKDYENLARSGLFLDMEAFSSAFLIRNKQHLESYSKKWVPDPLHQWSRQWEYPFVYERIASHCSTNTLGKPNILDAGSGITFFPYYLQSHLKDASVYCCDYDSSLENIYSLINNNEEKPIAFNTASLKNMGFQDSFFDCIYCISVLEHTNDYQDIIDEFHRIMKPNGLLVVTFDISLDGNNDISPAAAKRLLTDLGKRFSVTGYPNGDISALIKNTEILTTGYAKNKNPALLPWKKLPLLVRQIKLFLRKGRFSAFPPPFTVYCQSLTKRCA